MSVITFQATIENGQVRFAADVHLPEKTRVYVVVPDFAETANEKKFDLAELAARMPADYQPNEEDWGAPVGKEEW